MAKRSFLLVVMAALFVLYPVLWTAKADAIENPELAIVCLIQKVCDGITMEKANQILERQSKSLKEYRTQSHQTLIQFAAAGVNESSSPDEMDRAKKIIEQLLSDGLDVNERGALGLTALHDAVLFQNAEMTRFLLKHGASVSTKAGAGKFVGEDALEFANVLQKKKPMPGREKVIEILKARSTN